MLGWLRRRRKPQRPPAYEVPGSGVTDLARFLHMQLAALHPALRARAVWVMNQQWWGHCLAAEAATGTPVLWPVLWPALWADRDSRMLLGMPVRLDPLGGFPHLRDAQPERWLAAVRIGGRLYDPADVAILWKQVP